MEIEVGKDMPRVVPDPSDFDAWQTDLNRAINEALSTNKWERESTNWVLPITCPRCTHATNATVYEVIGLLPDFKKKDRKYEIVCDCSEGHSEGDKKVRGCGFGRKLLVHLDNPPS
jgi:hypothetical protein